MMDTMEFCRQTGIERQKLEAWVESGWVRPCGIENGARFSTMDLARAHLIRDLAGPMSVNDEGIGVILDLLDQIHGLRHALRSMTSAMSAEHVRLDAQAVAHMGPTRSTHASL